MIEVEFLELIRTASGNSNVFWGNSGGANLDETRIHIYPISENIETLYNGIQELRMMEVQVDIWTTNMTESFALRDKVETVNGFEGDNSIKEIFLSRLRSGSDSGNPSAVLFRYSLDFEVFYVK